MAMFNELLEVLADVPLTLVAGWAAWFGVGALLVLWFRRAKFEADMAPAPRQRRAVER